MAAIPKNVTSRARKVPNRDLRAVNLDPTVVDRLGQPGEGKVGCMSEGTADATGGGRNQFVYVVAPVSALGGLLFGYDDTGIISGALLFIKDDFGLTDNGQQIVVASLLLSVVFGALLGGCPLRPGAGWGRRRDGRAGLNR
jgi:hypothetical protein